MPGAVGSGDEEPAGPSGHTHKMRQDERRTPHCRKRKSRQPGVVGEPEQELSEAPEIREECPPVVFELKHPFVARVELVSDVTS